MQTLIVNGEFLLSGDATSVRVIFNNLTGVNSCGNKEVFLAWLAGMEHESRRRLFGPISIHSESGTELETGAVGEAFPGAIEVKQGVEDSAYVERMKALWRAPPLDMEVIEFLGTGDPAFGGAADDRPLGREGRILARGHTQSDLAVFKTIDEAHEAAKLIPNRRHGSLLGVLPRWR